MPDQSRFAGNSIEELLVSLADGLREAQSALNEAPLQDATGRPATSYHLPYLDFTIQVDVVTQSSTSGGRPFALVFTRSPAATSSSDSRSVRSTVSGRLVASPPGEGLPVPRIALEAREAGARTATLALRLTNSAGERLGFQTVELNIDTAAGAALSRARDIAPPAAPLRGTRLEAAVLTTDRDGLATTTLRIDPQEPAGGVIVVAATYGRTSARVAVPVPVGGAP